MNSSLDECYNLNQTSQPMKNDPAMYIIDESNVMGRTPDNRSMVGVNTDDSALAASKNRR